MASAWPGSVPRPALLRLAARVSAQAGFAMVGGQGRHPGQSLDFGLVDQLWLHFGLIIFPSANVQMFHSSYYKVK